MTAPLQESPKKTKKQRLFEDIGSLAVALSLVFMIRSSIVEAFKIPSGSMIPTLFIGDYIFVNKFAYGFHLPFTEHLPGGSIMLTKAESPKRGDIIVFIYPKDESLYYIKRVIGTPGDQIEMRNKVLYINGAPVPRSVVASDSAEKIFKKLDDPRYTSSSIDVFKETIEQKDHSIMIDKSVIMTESFPLITIPEGQLFVMGDNRDYSNDSRFWGFVPVKNVKGKAMVIWLSLWLGFSEGSKWAFRPERIGTLVR